MRKGVEYGVLSLFWLFIIIAIILSSLGWEILPLNEKVVRITVKSNIYAMDNALLAANSFMGTAMEYSVYQGCYEALKLGDSLPESREEFGNKLKGSIINVLNSYGSQHYMFMDKYIVYIPQYSGSDITGIDVSGSKTRVMVNELEAWTEEPVGVKDDIVLEKTIKLGGEFDIDCFGMYEKAVEKKNTVAADMGNKLKANKDLLLAGAGYRIEGSADDCRNLPGVFESSIKSELEEDVSVEVTDVNLNAMYQSSVLSGNERVCRFVSTGAANSTATITLQDDSGKTYPVWDGTGLVFEPLKAVFSLGVDY